MSLNLREAVPAFDMSAHKPIKGIIKAELFDAKTKKLIDKVEQENMVTNAIKNMIQAHAATNHMGDVMPLATVGLGGIMLFDEILTAASDNVLFPMDAHLVAYGTQEVDVDNVRKGSKNTAESVIKYGEEGMSRTVWDFGTSQANGTIKSVALTNARSPFEPLRLSAIGSVGYYSGSTRNLYKGNSILAYEDGYAYVLGTLTNSYTKEYISGAYHYTNNYTLTIRKVYAPTKSFKVADSPSASYYGPPNDLYQTLTWTKESVGNYVQLDANKGCVDFDRDGNAYIIEADSNSSGDGHMWVVKIVRDGLNWSIESMSYLTVSGAQLSSGYHQVVNGYYMIVSYDKHSVYKISIDNPQDVRQITLPDDHYFNDSFFRRSALKGGGWLFMTNYYVTNSSGASVLYYKEAILYPDGAIVLDGKLYSSSSGSNYENIGRIMLPFSDGYCFGSGSGDTSYYTYARYMSNYLGTIANLQTPIVKNASQTLKVTYTLVDA